MSLCPSSSHQLVAAAIAFRRARRKFPKDFGLESTVEHISGNTKVTHSYILLNKSIIVINEYLFEFAQFQGF